MVSATRPVCLSFTALVFAAQCILSVVQQSILCMYVVYQLSKQEDKCHVSSAGGFIFIFF